MKTSFTLLFFLIFTSFIQAQTKQEQLATVRIRGFSANNTTDLLTGVIIGYHTTTNTAFALTNSHLYEPSTYYVDVWPPHHPKPYKATILIKYLSKEPDVSLLQFHPTFPVSVVPLSSSTPPNGTSVRIRGYATGNMQKLHTGKIAKLNAYTNKCFEITTPISDGDSGSPVFYTDPSSKKSVVVGLCWGVDSFDTNHAMAEPISKIDIAMRTGLRNPLCISGTCQNVFPRFFQRQPQQPQQPLVKVKPPTQIQGPIGPPGKNGLPGKDGIVDYSKLEALQNEVSELKKELNQLRKSIPVSFQIEKR